MGRDTSGVKGMNVSAKVNGEPNRVLAMDIARDDSELFVVTENGYGKRTQVSEYPVKGRGTKGVLTAKLTAKKGGLAGALIVREHQDLLFISQSGMVQRTRAGGISHMGRSTQGVKVMNMKDDDCVSAVALVIDEDSDGEPDGQESLRGSRGGPRPFSDGLLTCHRSFADEKLRAADPSSHELEDVCVVPTSLTPLSFGTEPPRDRFAAEKFGASREESFNPAGAVDRAAGRSRGSSQSGSAE